MLNLKINTFKTFTIKGRDLLMLSLVMIYIIKNTIIITCSAATGGGIKGLKSLPDSNTFYYFQLMENFH